MFFCCLRHSDIDEVINNLMTFDETFELPKHHKRSLNKPSYKMIKTELQKVDIRDSKDDSIQIESNKVVNEKLLNEQSTKYNKSLKKTYYLNLYENFNLF